MLSQLELGLVFRLFASGWSFLNFAHSGYANNYRNFLLTTFFLEVYARWFVRFFPDGLLPVCFGVPFLLPSSPLFPSRSEFRCGEPVGEGERGRPFPLTFLSGSCLNAHESPNEHWPFVVQRMHACGLRVSGALAQECTQERPPSHQPCLGTFGANLCDGPTRFSRHPSSTHDPGRLRFNEAVRKSATRPYVGLTAQCAVSLVGVRPASDPVDSGPEPFLRTISTLDRVFHSLVPWMCHRTQEPTVLSRVSNSLLFPD